MNNELTVPAQSAAITAPLATPLRKAGIVLAGSAFVAICAHIALPLYISPVPLTMQTFAVFALGLLLPPRLAADTLIAYLVEGAVGLPVFAPAPAMFGLAHLLGPTGGYLLACPLAAVIISLLWRKSQRSFVAAANSTGLGALVILSSGILGLAVFTHTSLRPVLAAGFFPFLPGEALKVAAVAVLAVGVQRFAATSHSRI